MDNKIQLSITIDKELIAKFREYCKMHSMKVSTKMEDLVKKELESQNH